MKTIIGVYLIFLAILPVIIGLISGKLEAAAGIFFSLVIIGELISVICIGVSLIIGQ